MTKAPYKEMDANIVAACKAINSFPGLATTGSCGGHARPKPYQEPAGSWHIAFRAARDDDGCFALEFLAWLINNNLRRGGRKIRLEIYSAPPYLNEPGDTLTFHIFAQHFDATHFAGELRAYRRKFYIPPEKKKRPNR